MPRRNAAGRLLEFLKRANGIVDNRNALDAWAESLQLTHIEGELPIAVQCVRLMHELHQQVVLVREEFGQRGFDAASYVPQLDRVQHAFNPRHINANWHTAVKQHLTGDVIPLLQFMAEVSAEEEAEIS